MKLKPPNNLWYLFTRHVFPCWHWKVWAQSKNPLNPVALESQTLEQIATVNCTNLLTFKTTTLVMISWNGHLLSSPSPCGRRLHFEQHSIASKCCAMSSLLISKYFPSQHRCQINNCSFVPGTYTKTKVMLEKHWWMQNEESSLQNQNSCLGRESVMPQPHNSQSVSLRSEIMFSHACCPKGTTLQRRMWKKSIVIFSRRCSDNRPVGTNHPTMPE